MSEDVSAKFKKVMTIDDNAIDLYITSRLIKKNNFATAILPFSNAKEALNYLIENQNSPELLPEIIFVDIYMPLMSGFEFLIAYHSFPEQLKFNCQIFVISSTIDQSDLDKANSDPNVTSFQVKPITIDFLNSIKSIL